MGKISVTDSRKKEKQRHDPLYKELSTQGGNLRSIPRGNNKVSNKKSKKDNDEEYIDAATSRKILQLAKEQQEELVSEESELKEKTNARFIDYDESEDDEEEYSDFAENEEYDELEEEIEIDEKDAAMFEQYFGGQSFNLADKIMAKIQEKEQMKSSESVERPDNGVMLPPKLIQAYTAVGEILRNWKHGKLPKIFKVIPSLQNWQDPLFVTNPEAWTPQSVYEATKLFVSNLTANEAQKYIEMVLLERFRNDIADSEDHTLNYHIYRSLKKALYKPGAFFKGFLIPLVESGCTVREATIAASVLAKVSVPGSHAAAALTNLLQLEFNPAITVFIRILIDKKYALPYQTIDDCVFYFMRFRNAAQQNNGIDDMIAEDEDSKKKLPPLPVVWHKAFLAFAQRYKNDITDDQRDFLLETVRQRFHKDIGPEIKRELLAGKARPGPQIEEKEALMMDAFQVIS